MSKEIDLIKNIIKEVDDNLYSFYGNAPQLIITDKLRDLLSRLDTPEVRYFFENYEQQDQRIAELEEQLAEKDKEIKCLKIDLGMYKSVNEFINNYGIEKAREVLLQSEKTKKQDKISFAIEQLEKVKNEITPIFCVPNGIYSNLHNEVFKTIDNQIKQLKDK